MIENFRKNYLNHPKTDDEMFQSGEIYRNHYSNFINNFSKESLENLNKKE